MALKGGRRCADAAIYTREFCSAIVEGYRLHVEQARRRCERRGSLRARDYVDSILNEICIGADDEEDCPGIDELVNLLTDEVDVHARLPKSTDDGIMGEIALDEVDAEEDVVAWDDMKGRELDPKEVLKARSVEMGYVGKHGVYEYAPVSECRAKTGAEPVGTKWLDTNKGDDKNPVYRSRWVAQQYRRAWVESIFSATPNIETVRLLLADAANRCRPIGKAKDHMAVVVIDIKRAYFYAPAQKEIYVRLPPEDPQSNNPEVCGRLKKSLYGTRDAGANWHLAYSNFLAYWSYPRCI